MSSTSWACYSLRRLKHSDPTLISLDLSANAIDDARIIPIAAALKRNSSLTTLDLRDNLVGVDGTGAIVEALTINTSVRSLYLNGNRTVGARGIQAFTAAPRSLTTLNLTNTSATFVGARAIADYLQHPNCSLSTLYFGHNTISDEGARSISESLVFNSSLTALHLESNSIREAGTQAIAASLECNSSLTYLNLIDNPIGPIGARFFAPDTPLHLSHLVLSNTLLRSEGTIYLAQALKFNFPITHLDLENNAIDFEGGQAIAEALHVNSRLISLDLRRNNIGDTGARLFSEMLKLNVTLQHLDLRHNAIGLAGARLLQHSLSINLCLQSLHLGDAGIPKPLQLKILSISKRRRSVIDLRQANLTNEDAQQISFATWRCFCSTVDLRNNPQLTRLPLGLADLDPNITLQIKLDPILLKQMGLPLESDAALPIINYTRELLEGKPIELQEVKLMVVGRAAVGKTSLVRALCHETFDANILSTDGIDIGSFSVEDARFICWDFAGQTVYRYTNQLFLTPNAIYLVLFKIRDGNRSET